MSFDFVVIGGGIAGIAVAELLQRSGQQVLIMEKNDRLCAESSAAQQGWFHSGALYAALPNRKYLKMGMENLANLTRFYADFSAMNLQPSGDLTNATVCRPWFHDAPIFYLYANTRDDELSWLQRCYWPVAKRVAKRALTKGFTNTHQSFPAHQLLHNHADLVLSSCDRTMDTVAIAHDLVNSFISNGGKVTLNSEVLSIEKNTVHHRDGKETARFIIVSSGSSIPTLRVQHASIIQSPILVLNRPLASLNFVKMHPQINQTFNHVVHEVDGEQYSVIANALYFRQPPDLVELHERLLMSANKLFGEQLTQQDSSIFLGKKTELPTRWWSSRNYRPVVVDAEHFTIALPGKFSFCFTLAIEVCRHFGIVPKLETECSKDYADIPIQAPEHVVRYRQLKA